VLADVRRGTMATAVATVCRGADGNADLPRVRLRLVREAQARSTERTREYWLGFLAGHLLPFFADYPLDAITSELVDRCKTAKLRERERWDDATEEERRKRLVPQGLGAYAINRSISLLSRLLDEAVEYGHIVSNPAQGKKRRLKVPKPTRTWLELHEAQAVLEAAGSHRALVATMMLGGLRVGELIALRWRDVDLAGGTIRVARS
jgi:integrase